MSRQMFEQIVVLERAIDDLARRVAVLEARPAPAETAAADSLAVPTVLRRGPGRPPKTSYGESQQL